FNKGDLIVWIDDRQAKLDINSAKSDFLNALATVLPEIKLDFPEAYNIYQTYFNQCTFDGNLQEFPVAQNQQIKLFLTRYNVYKLYFTVRNLEIRHSKHFFYAPFNGVIARTELREGATVRSGAQLGEILNMDELEVKGSVQVRDLQWIDGDRPVRFTSKELDGQWNGCVKRVSRNIDAQTQTVPVFITLENGHRQELFDGIFLNAVIPGKTIAHAITLPQNAVYNDNTVYILKNGRLLRREIHIARTERESIIINEGVADGDTVVTEALQGVADGMQVQADLSR
ncbi:MAG: efflux RND transporter periplasmic adaptor subunit, partial [Caldithrix sp.]|nr:efflux RND transporter periplasmic adaptor subunit [Caldithrix sp.]